MNIPNKQKKHVNTENRIVVTKGEGAGGEWSKWVKEGNCMVMDEN